MLYFAPDKQGVRSTLVGPYYLTHLIGIATKHPYIYTMTSETSDSVPAIKKRSRPQPRVRETSLERDGDAMQGDEEPAVLPCVNSLFLHVQGST